jgi:choline dehydrogenase-like flavoprotein
MIIDDQIYDVIIVGTGAGGGTLAHQLAPTGKKILILERGDFMPLAEQNPSNVDIFKRERYHAPEQWYDQAGEPFSPQMNYAVGGNTKIYGSVLFRFRERDFQAMTHQSGQTQDWCRQYADFASYYTAAEQLYQVHGQTGADPTEPPREQDYPFAAIDHDPQIADLNAAIAKFGLHPARLPLGVNHEQADFSTDAESNALQPALKLATQEQAHVTLKTQAKVVCLHTNPSGRVVKAVEAEVKGQTYLFQAHLVVLSCGAVNSAALLLRSANDCHPQGLGNRSGLVGRNLMKSLMTAIVQLKTTPNSGTYHKTLYINDFYWGDADYPYPMGHIQTTGGLLNDMIFAEAPPMFSVLARFMPGFGLKQLATHSIGWWAQTADLPNPQNRVTLEGNKIIVNYQVNNSEAHDRLICRWIEVLKTVEKDLDGFQRGVLHPRGEIPIQVMANQCGTCRFGEDPNSSVLDPNCRSHELDNLYVVDGSFFPSNASVSPALTIMANALRVGDHLIERLG